MPKVSKTDQKIQEVIDRGIEHLDEIFEMLMDEAKGVHFVVSPKLHIKDKPRHQNADFVCLADEVEKICPSCRRPVMRDPPVTWEVWREKRDSVLLKFLYEQMAGKAKSREQDKVDPEIYVIFGDIDSVDNEETETTNEVKELNGSRLRTSERNDAKLEHLTIEEAPKIGIKL